MQTLRVIDFVNAQDNQSVQDEVLLAFQHAQLSRRFNKKMSRIFKAIKNNTNEPKRNK